jgi:hypothetical protein
MSRYLEKLELWTDRAFWNSKRLPKHHILIPCLTKIILAKEYENIMNHKCPYCNYISPTRHHLRNHVLAKHRETYYSDIKRVVYAYLKLQKLITKIHSKYSYYFALDLPKMPRIYFRKKAELCTWIDFKKDLVLPILTQ